MGVFENLPYTNFHELNLDWVLETVKKLADDWATYYATWDDWKNTLSGDFSALQTFVNDYFDNLDVTEEISDKLEEMYQDGSLAALVSPYLRQRIEALEQQVTDLETYYHGQISNIVHPVPTFVSSTSAMTNAQRIYVLTTNQHIYQYVNNAWQDTGVVYSGAEPAYLAPGHIARGIISVTSTVEDGVDITCSSSCRLITRDGGVVNLDNQTVHIAYPGSALFYICWNSLTNQFEAVNYASQDRLLMKYTPVFGVYGGLIVKLDANIESPIEQTQPFTEPYQSTIRRGYFFVWMEGKNLRVESTADARVSYKGSLQSAGNLSLTQPITTQAIVIYRDGVIRTSGTVFASDIIIARCYNYVITTDYPEYVICNAYNIATRIPLYQRSGMPYNINFDRLGYQVRINNTQYFNNRGDFLELRNAYGAGSTSFNIFPKGFKYNPQGVVTGSLQVLENTVDLANKKVLMIGDSVLNRGWIQRTLKNKWPSISFVGTNPTGQGIGDNSFMSEAYPGQTIQFFTSANGPFWNPVSQQVDFAYYLTQNHISYDYIVILLGLNETLNSETWYNQTKILIDSIFAQNANAKVYFCTQIAARTGASTNQYSVSESRPMLYEGAKTVPLAFSNCKTIPTFYVLSDDHDYNMVEVDYTYGTEKLKVASDNIHPAEATGFQQLAAIIAAYLGT